MNVLNVKNLSHSYNEVKVLEDISFSIKEKELVAIIGNNGAGKTTLLKLLTKNLQVQKGCIKYTNKNIGYVKQKVNGSNNFPTTIKELVLSSTYHQKGFLKYPSKEEKKEALENLEKVGLKGFENRLLSQLSGGQVQRAMIARAIATKAPIIILDEPTSGIDPSSIDNIFKLLKDLSINKSIIVVTHDLFMVNKYADRVLCLEDGSILELSKKQLSHELAHKHKHKDKDHNNIDHCTICNLEEDNKC